ncbi:MAG: amidohydrolase family protein [Candidatus Limnocylindrales bacterium]
MDAPALASAARPPFALRGRVLTPLAEGNRFIADGTVVVDAEGRIASVTETAAAPASAAVIDVRPWLLLPGLIDLHAHLPQLPNAGLGAGMDLLSWLERYIFPLERDFDEATAERLAPAAFRAFARAGTTTAVLYGAVYEASLDAAFRAAEAHGTRAVIGKVMMDRLRYDEVLPDALVLETSLRQSADLCARWHGRDDGRLRYAFTPRFAVSCSPEMLRESARLAAATGAYWQTHLFEDRGEMAEVARLFPTARDYTDVYDAAGGLGPRAILAHAIHLTDREVARLAETGTRIAHCPESNLFLASGVMPLARYLEAGLVVGLGSDVAAGPDVSIFRQMRVGAQAQAVLVSVAGERRPALAPLEWFRLATLGAARALGLETTIGSLEAGKEADLIAVDPSATAPLPGLELELPDELMSRLIFRDHPDMVRAAWVRGRRLDGPLDDSLRATDRTWRQA